MCLNAVARRDRNNLELASIVLSVFEFQGISKHIAVKNSFNDNLVRPFPMTYYGRV